MKTVEWASTSGPAPDEIDHLLKIGVFHLVSASVNTPSSETNTRITLYYEPLSCSMYRCVERGSSREWFVSDSLG